MPKAKVIEVIQGDWYEWNKHERWVCCDCSLVHAVEYRERNGKLQVRFFRRDRSTAAYRRHQGIKVVCKNDANRHAKSK